jgi:predicted exporter
LKLKHFERIRFLLIALALIGGGFYLFLKYPPSGDISKALPDDNATQILSLYNQFDSSKKLLVLIHGFEPESLNKAYAIKEKLSTLSEVESVYFDASDIDPRARKYLGESWYYLSDFNSTVLDRDAVKKRLEALAASMQVSGAYTALDTTDPLGLFTKPSFMPGVQRDGMTIVPGRGYCVMASIRPSVSDMEGSRRLYNEVKAVLAPYKNEIVVFSPNFYSVENSAYIKSDVEKITALTILILIGVYFFLLRNKVMLFFSLVTLFLSGLMAILLVKVIFADVSILVVAFGAGIATIAEDYLFMLFLNNDYKKHRFNWPVFWGFVTTEIGLASLIFIDFPLISQLAAFAFFSLAISYSIFVFIFPRLQFFREESKAQSETIFDTLLQWRKIPPLSFTLLSIVLIAASFSFLSFDSNFRHLDYQNRPLLEAEKLFEETLGSDRIPVIIQGERMESLLLHAETLNSRAPSSFSIANVALSHAKSTERARVIHEYDFAALRRHLESTAKDAGFRSGIFAEAYKPLESLSAYAYDAEALRLLGGEIVKSEKGYMSLAYVKKDELANIEQLPFLIPIDGKELLSHSASNALEEFTGFLGIGFLCLLIIIVAVTRSRALYALNFLFFPMSVILALFALTGSYNLMHLFALFLIMVYGIDYGIYLSRGELSNTIRAVIYSCVTTFAGFGVLILSDVPAVHSIGEVTIAGLAAIVALFFQRGKVQPCQG